MRIGRDHTAAMVIDIQEKLFPVMNDTVSLLENCKILIKGLQILQIPMIVTQQYSKGLGETIPEISSIIRDFSFIEKRDFSCCGEPEVMVRLMQLNAKNVIICGIESHVCVMQTALDLKASGFVPVIVADAVSSRYVRNYELARERFRNEGILVTSAESVLFELLVTSASQEFKAVLSLIK